MTISDELTTLQNTKTAIKNAIVAKGVTVADTDAFASYADKIGTIETGSGSGSAEVAGLTIDNFVSVDSNGKLTRGSNSEFVCTATDIGDRCFYYIYNNNATITSISFPNVTTISGSMAFQQSFYNCRTLASINFPNLKNISGWQGMSSAFSMSSGFSTSPSLTSIDLPKLETITGYGAMSYTFENCESLTTAFFPKLTTISGSGYGMAHTFSGCSSLTSITFPNLTTVDVHQGMADTFRNCSNLESVNFPVLCNLSGNQAMYSCFSGCNKLTTLDLPSLEGSIYNNTFAYNNTLTKVWIPKEVTTIKAATSATGTSYSYSYSPFYGCSTDLVIYTDATEKLEGWSNYCFNVSSSAEATVVYGATHENFENGTLPDSYPALTVTIPEGCSISGTYNNSSVRTNTIRMFPNDNITLTFTISGYMPISKTYTIGTEDITATVTTDEFTAYPSSLALSYPYTGQNAILSTLVDDENYKIDSTNSAIINIPSSSDGKTGYYGYLIISPETDTTLSITYSYSKISSNYSYGCHAIYVGTSQYKPTIMQIFNGTADGSGSYLERGWGSTYYANGSTTSTTGANTLHTVSTTLTAGETYYISFAATKSTATYNSGTFVITDITTTSSSTDSGDNSSSGGGGVMDTGSGSLDDGDPPEE